MNPITVSLDQLRKYNVPGPRYTSYPPATHFTEEFQTPNPKLQTPTPLSLYFHLPFCTKQCLYCGCTNIITVNQSKSAEYLGYLEREIALRTPFVAEGSETVQIQLGGGTPTFFLPTEIEQLGQLIRDRFPMASAIEAGVEIDPRSLTLEKVEALRAAGFNRASLGIQDTCPEVQQTIARIQPLEMIAERNQWLRDSGMESINFDLIYGLPNQTLESFNRTLDEALVFSPDRFAIYSYAHIPWIKTAQKSYEDKLPDAEMKLQLLQLTIEKLTSAGYVYIGMDHFAKPDDGMAQALANGTLQRNFQGYSTHKGVALHGFGMSAISHFGDTYLQNQKELAPYYAALDNGQPPLLRGYAMTAEDKIRYHAIMHIMCNLYIDYAPLSQEIGVDFTEHFKAELDSLDDLEADGLLLREEKGLSVTPLGRLFIRIIAMRFDAYLQAETRKGRYSQTV
ncbi:oxygen-independent coproporphyrinogen III oxidase [Pontiella sulfatireligans]|uniref:Coproporphyrinogen-III oxidase n=1 Tax=Pontiella sulfatireligans TaxID=2750658 RepID=A0A6C2UIV4_9BACT|nr:oxygen-independent coproporphyrinogen III oxidase [Pontiella sulfatireligans]VGO19889.1 Oxygen-independent coproporphyrinogen III oxidase [Pontiella sulfatireligans]